MFLSRFEKTRDTIISEFVKKKLSGKKVLEIGCGEGERTKLFYNHCKVVGVDIENKINIEHQGGFEFVNADAVKLPFQDCLFDAVVSFDTIEHIDDDVRSVKEAFRVCKNEGYFIIGTPNRLRFSNRLMKLIGKKITYPYQLGPDVIHLREYTMSELENIVKEAGFKISESLYIWIGLVGKIDKGFKKFPAFLNSLSQYLLIIAIKIDG